MAALNAGKQAIDGRFCRIWVYEPEIPKSLLKLQKKDS